MAAVGSVMSHVLSPLGVLYGWYQNRRLQGTGSGVSAPVIAVDRLTPDADRLSLTISILQILQMMGRTPAVLWGGMSGMSSADITQVDPMMQTAAEVGDEALLLSAFAPVWMGRGRAHLAERAIAKGADILLSDGIFNTAELCADVAIITVGAEQGFGNGKCWPAGPLPVPLDFGLERADMLITVGDDRSQRRFLDQWANRIPIPHLTAQYSVLETGMDWQDMPVLAFAGIARPEAFFLALRQLGANLIRAEALSDHQELTPALLHRLETSANQTGAQLVTTEQDAVRLPVGFRQKVLTVPIRLQINENDALQDLLRAKCFG